MTDLALQTPVLVPAKSAFLLCKQPLHTRTDGGDLVTSPTYQGCSHKNVILSREVGHTEIQPLYPSFQYDGLCVYVCMCVHVCACVCMCICVCMCVCERKHTTHDNG